MTPEELIRLFGYPAVPFGGTPEPQPIPQPPAPVAQPPVMPQPAPVNVQTPPAIPGPIPEMQQTQMQKPFDFKALAAQQAMKLLSQPDEQQSPAMPLGMALMGLGQQIATPRALRGRNDNLQSMANALLMWQVKNQAQQDQNNQRKIAAMSTLEKLYAPTKLGKGEVLLGQNYEQLAGNPEQYSLSPGQKRMAGEKVIAEAPQKPIEFDRINEQGQKVRMQYFPDRNETVQIPGSEGQAYKPEILIPTSGKGQPVQWVPGQPIPEGYSTPSAVRIDMGQMSPEAQDNIIQGLKEGTVYPSQLSKRATDYNQLLSKARENGVDLAKLAIQEQGAKSFARNLNTGKIANFRMFADTINSTIQRVRELANAMDLSGFRPANYLEIEGLMKTAGNTELGKLATAYVTEINGLKTELAQTENAGYAPTEHVWKLVSNQINQNYGVGQLHTALDEVDRLIKYRVNALNQMGPMFAGAQTSNLQQQPGQTQPQTGANSLQASYQSALKRVQAMPEGPAKQTELQKLQQRAKQLGL